MYTLWLTKIHQTETHRIKSNSKNLKVEKPAKFNERPFALNEAPNNEGHLSRPASLSEGYNTSHLRYDCLLASPPRVQ